MIPLILLSACTMTNDADSTRDMTSQTPSPFVAEGATVQKLPGTFRFTEGPSWTKRGTLVFTDIPANILYEWDGKEMKKLLEPSGNANGTTVLADGSILVCHHGTRNVTKVGADGKQTVLVDQWDGKKFNSPNDIAVHPGGTVFFTDPSYGLPRGEELPYGVKNVFFIRDGKAVKVMTGRNQPNGLVFSPDGKKLYVADSAASKIDVLDVDLDGEMTPKELCDAPGPDGIRMDPEGRIWAACGDGVRVISPSGELLETIKFPEQPANLCFGEDGGTLFVTARTGVYSLKLKVKGIRPGF